MTTVKFCAICDAPNCGKRSEEYAAWPYCRECKLHTCPDHTVPGSHRDEERNVDGEDVQTYGSVYCTDCKATWGDE